MSSTLQFPTTVSGFTSVNREARRLRKSRVGKNFSSVRIFRHRTCHSYLVTRYSSFSQKCFCSIATSEPERPSSSSSSSTSSSSISSYAGTAPSAASSDVPFTSVYNATELSDYYRPRTLQLASRVYTITAATLRVALVWFKDEVFPSPQGVQRGKVLRDVISGMGPVFVKLGQTLSTRPDLIGEEACEALGELQDQMPNFDDLTAFQTISAELNWSGPICPDDKREGLDADTPALFQQLSMKPVAAASLGQVYRGVTKEGVEVAVKVQRPNLMPQVSRDLYLVRAFLAWWETTFQSGALTPDIADSLGEGIFLELDYLSEAANMDAFTEAHSHLEFIAVPGWLPHYTNTRVLTTEWVRGRPLKSLTKQEQVRMAQMGVEASVAQLLSTGVLHADPHEGNLLYGDDGKLYFLDFGLLSRMEQRHMEGMASGILHMLSGEWVKLIDDFGQMELIQPPFLQWDWKGNPQGWFSITEHQFRQAFVSVMQDKGKDMSERRSFGELFVELGALASDFRFTCPPYYILVMRSFVTLEGVAARADPDFNIYEAAVPYAVRRGLTPQTESGRQALRAALLNERGELRLDDLGALANSAASDPTPQHSRADGTTESEASKSSSDRVVAAVQEVLVSREGNALRRVLHQANSLHLLNFILASNAVKLLVEGAKSASESSAPSSASAQHIASGKGAVSPERASWRLSRVLRVLALHHLQAVWTSGGVRGYFALFRLGLALLPFAVSMLYKKLKAWVRGTQKLESVEAATEIRPVVIENNNQQVALA